ncbi:CUB domain [Trinorchestia longiramus]|nr:CUB domain [Trinorchestia longiramus]
MGSHRMRRVCGAEVLLLLQVVSFAEGLQVLNLAGQASTSSNTLGNSLAATQIQTLGFNAANLLPNLLSNFVRVIPASCTTGLGTFTSGICLSPKACAAQGGTATASCAMNFGTCCVLRYTCAQTALTTCHYFSNPSYPNTDTAVTGGTCGLTVQPCQNNICQIRLDFEDVDIAMPDALTGNCNVDNIVITGNGANPSKIPNLCGTLDGQHIYINVEPTCNPTTINVDLNAANNNGRKFNIKVTQIPCMSKDLAPPGCLQYYNSTSGTVTSFNYNAQGQMKLIAGQNYATCIASQPGYCSITWRRTPNSTFELPDPVECYPGTTAGCNCCHSSYILIPGATCSGVAFDPACSIRDPRFCGDSFAAGRHETVSWHQPFTLFTYIPQPLGAMYSGYSLDYTLNRC